MKKTCIPSTLTVTSLCKSKSASVNSDLFNLHFETQGLDFQPPSTDNFALWISLPIAMATGRNLFINGTVSPTSLRNARVLVDIWSKWSPSLFKHIEVDATQIMESRHNNQRPSDLMLYSGGLDSTYALLKHYINTLTPVSLLTVHGMDYKTTDVNRFKELTKKIHPLTSLIKGEHYYLKSNATEVMSKFGIDGGIGHGFQLFASLFIFEAEYSAGAIAADCSPLLDFIISPWGTNHLTNNLFKSESFFVKTLDNELDRAEKAGKLMILEGKENALAALSFCKNRQSRPHNCGLCSKCIRTKAMFYTETGSIPNIFSDPTFVPQMLGTIDISRRGERALVLDLLSSARRNGKLEEFQWLEERVRQPPTQHKKKPFYSRALKSAKNLIRGPNR